MVAALIALALAAAPVTHDTLPVYVAPPSSTVGVDYAYAWEAGGGSRLALGVFKLPRTLADIVPPEVATFARFTRGRLSRSRLLIATGAIRVYGFPADRHEVCFLRAPRGGGSCV